MTLREEVEVYLGVRPAKPARIRQSYPMINNEAPSHWRKTLKLWAKVMLTFVLASMAIGFISGLIERLM